MQNELSPEIAAVRSADYEIDPIFLNRWSPRAFSSQKVDDETLHRVFEAARWAPSSVNEQPWRYIVARSDEDRARFLEFLMPANQAWAKDAPVLIVVISKKTFSHNGTPNGVYQFDAGCTWGYLSLAAAQNGLITHGMAGFDREGARTALGIPDDFEPLAVIALGYHGETAQLPAAYQAREVPSNRRPQSESVFEGRFGG